MVGAGTLFSSSSRVFQARREVRAARPLVYPDGVPEWAGRRSELTGAFEYLSDEELAAAWATNGLERVVFRNGTAADIAAIASAFGFTNEPVQWVELSKYLRDNRANAAVVAAAVELNSLAMFYTSLGDGKEGVAAFLEKRDPDFTGRASDMPFYPWD